MTLEESSLDGTDTQSEPCEHSTSVEPERALSPELEAELEERRAATRRSAALILEVLVGERTSGEAARELGVSLTRYYTLEQRAIDGLVAACEPRPRGPRKDPEREILRLKAELERVESLARRSASLLRLSQRSLGVRPSDSSQREQGEPKKRGASKKSSGAKRKRVRRGKARALTRAKKLRGAEGSGAGEGTVDVTNAKRENPGEVKTKEI